MPGPSSPISSPTSLRSPLLPPETKIPITGNNEHEKLYIDHMLQKYCGEFGAYQLRHFVLTSLAWALEAFHTMIMIFADREPEWSCSGVGCSPTATSVCGFDEDVWRWSGGTSSSTVSEWGLICGEKYKVGLVQALFFGGCMIGNNSIFFIFLLFMFYFFHSFVNFIICYYAHPSYIIYCSSVHIFYSYSEPSLYL